MESQPAGTSIPWALGYQPRGTGGSGGGEGTPAGWGPYSTCAPGAGQGSGAWGRCLGLGGTLGMPWWQGREPAFVGPTAGGQGLPRFRKFQMEGVKEKLGKREMLGPQTLVQVEAVTTEPPGLWGAASVPCSMHCQPGCSPAQPGRKPRPGLQAPPHPHSQVEGRGAPGVWCGWWGSGSHSR